LDVVEKYGPLERAELEQEHVPIVLTTFLLLLLLLDVVQLSGAGSYHIGVVEEVIGWERAAGLVRSTPMSGRAIQTAIGALTPHSGS